MCESRERDFSEDQDSRPLNMPVPRVVANAVVKAPFHVGTPHNLTAVKPKHSSGSLTEFAVPASPPGSYGC